MKKTLLFAFALLFATATMAQNRAVLLQESFDGATMPTGWSISAQPNNWSVSATNNAGGEANEMHLAWSPQFNGMTRLVSPAVNLTGINSVVFSFKHALDNYSGSNTIGVATSSDEGYNTSNSWTVSQEINTPDMGQANVQFCIFFNGSSYNINDWFFDDIMVFTLENLDLSISSVTLPDFIGSGEAALGIKVFNFGSTTVTSVEASYTIEGMSPVTETFSVNIPSLGTETLNFNTTFRGHRCRRKNPDDRALLIIDLRPLRERQHGHADLLQQQRWSLHLHQVPDELAWQRRPVLYRRRWHTPHLLRCERSSAMLPRW